MYLEEPQMIRQKTQDGRDEYMHSHSTVLSIACHEERGVTERRFDI